MHGVKQCPKCGVSVKKEGCNKVRCGIYKTPFCWVCLVGFGLESEVYEHMTVIHGTWVDLGGPGERGGREWFTEIVMVQY